MHYKGAGPKGMQNAVMAYLPVPLFANPPIIPSNSRPSMRLNHTVFVPTMIL